MSSSGALKIDNASRAHAHIPDHVCRVAGELVAIVGQQLLVSFLRDSNFFRLPYSFHIFYRFAHVILLSLLSQLTIVETLVGVGLLKAIDNALRVLILFEPLQITPNRVGSIQDCLRVVVLTDPIVICMEIKGVIRWQKVEAFLSKNAPLFAHQLNFVFLELAGHTHISWHGSLLYILLKQLQLFELVFSCLDLAGASLSRS